MKTQRHGGHTLLELLVAVVVTALIAAGGYAGLNAISRANGTLREEVEKLESVQWFVTRLDRDLFQVINRPVRTDSGELAALRGDPASVSLTHTGLSNPLRQARSELQRVDWVLSENRIYRHAHTVLDGPGTNMTSAELLADHITALNIEYLGAGNNWHPRWPTGAETGLPRAVRYRLQIEGFGTLERVIELPGARS